jgi:hypothetical protein
MPYRPDPALLKLALAVLEAQAGARATEVVGSGFSLEAAAAGHAKQLCMTTDQARHIIALCSRRAGKTTGIADRYAHRSMARADGNRIYVALNSIQARDIMWEPIWKPLCQRWRLPVRHNETRMVSRFDNGSKVRFTGTDDTETIRKELGAGLDEACIDESQDQKDSVLRPLVERILPPALADRAGTIILAGTVPEVEAGLFWDIWKAGTWSAHNWSLFDNPHMREPMQRLREHLEKNPHLTEDSPIIQREWFGRFVFDSAVVAYGYSQDRDAYAPTRQSDEDDLRAELEAAGIRIQSLMAAVPHAGIEFFSVGIDPGGGDRFPVQVWGWGERVPYVQHVFDFCPPRDAGLSWGKVELVLRYVARHYPTGWWFYDAGGSDVELDTFHRDTGIPAIAAARKSDTKGQIRRVKNLLEERRGRVMRGSSLEEDFQKARRDPSAPHNGGWKWDPRWHPDSSEAARYALAPYFDSYAAPAPVLTIEQAAKEQHDEERARLFVPREDDPQSAGLARFVNGAW